MESIESRCQSIYRNLLQARGIAVNQSPAVFIRELEETARCDKFYYFADIRKAYRTEVGDDSMQRILSFKETNKDDRRARQAVLHYYDWTQKNLVKALDWESWLWFRTVYKFEHTIALFTKAGGVVGGWQFVRPHNWWQQQPPSQQ